jgi:transposase-like protein
MQRRKPEQIVTWLHQVDAAFGQGKTIEDICREHGISSATYQGWTVSAIL